MFKYLYKLLDDFALMIVNTLAPNNYEPTYNDLESALFIDNEEGNEVAVALERSKNYLSLKHCDDNDNDNDNDEEVI